MALTWMAIAALYTLCHRWYHHGRVSLHCITRCFHCSSLCVACGRKLEFDQSMRILRAHVVRIRQRIRQSTLTKPFCAIVWENEHATRPAA
jgi:hypothetical protein